MRVGVRLQIVLALSVLLLLGLAPLFAAVAGLTDATLRTMRVAAARSLGEVVALHVERSGLGDVRDPDAWRPILERELSASVLGVALRDDKGKLVATAGDPAAAEATAEHPAASSGPGVEIGHPPALTGVAEPTVGPPLVTAIDSEAVRFRVVVPARAFGTVVAEVRAPSDRGHAAPLLRLVGLYTAMVALALLVFAYTALTRMIVRPLESLSGAARRVAEGARTFEPPASGAKELAELGVSLSEMTATLLSGEERMRAQISELESRARELREAQDRLVRSERLASVGRLAAGLAHEIGNPIAAMMGLEDLMLQGGLDATEQHDFLVRIRAETERVHGVLRDLLDFARPTSPLPGGAPKPGDVRAAIDDVLALVRPQRSFRNVRLEPRVADGLPLVVLERERIMQVLLNLLMNAADAAPKGTVRLVAESDESGVVIRVEDDGPGVDPSIASRLFEPFVSSKEVGKGTGLGLAVCRGLVEAAGGKIALEPCSRGARFVVSLPRASTERPADDR